MNPKEKESAIKSIMDMMMKSDTRDPMQQAIDFMVSLPTIVEEIWNKGRIDGFKEGYAEAKRKLEKTQSKLN